MRLNYNEILITYNSTCLPCEFKCGFRNEQYTNWNLVGGSFTHGPVEKSNKGTGTPMCSRDSKGDSEKTAPPELPRLLHNPDQRRGKLSRSTSMTHATEPLNLATFPLDSRLAKPRISILSINLEPQSSWLKPTCKPILKPPNFFPRLCS